VRLCLLRLGLAASRLNTCETVAHSWDPSFEAPAVSWGPRYTICRPFREFTLSVGVVTLLAWSVFRQEEQRRREQHTKA
jgi:hypothetical protein